MRRGGLAALFGRAGAAEGLGAAIFASISATTHPVVEMTMDLAARLASIRSAEPTVARQIIKLKSLAGLLPGLGAGAKGGV